MKRSTLLIVGSERRMSDQLVAVYMKNAIKSQPHKLAMATEQSVYLFDGLSIMGEPLADKVSRVVSNGAADIKLAKDVFDVLPLIDELYGILKAMKKPLRFTMKSYGETPTIIRHYARLVVCTVTDGDLHKISPTLLPCLKTHGEKVLAELRQKSVCCICLIWKKP